MCFHNTGDRITALNSFRCLRALKEGSIGIQFVNNFSFFIENVENFNYFEETIDKSNDFEETIENFDGLEETIENFQWFWRTSSPLNVFWYSDHCQRWFFNGFWVAQPLVSMVFDGQGPLVKRWNGFNGSNRSTCTHDACTCTMYI